MREIVDDDMLEKFVPRGTYAEIARVLRERYGDLSRRITFPIPDDPADDRLVAEVIGQLQAAV
jgi:hypothetical protein